MNRLVELHTSHKVWIGFSRSLYPDIVSKFQRWWFKIDYTHAYIRFKIHREYGQTLNLVLHATSMGLHVVSWKQFITKRTPVRDFEIAVSPGEYRNFLIYAFDTTGKPYGTKQMFGAGIAAIFRLKSNPFGNVNETFCSKAVGNVMNKFFGFSIPGDANLWIPKHICEFLQKEKDRGLL